MTYLTTSKPLDEWRELTLGRMADERGCPPTRYCEHCEDPLARRPRESAATFARRRFCNKICYERSRDPRIQSRARTRAGSAFAMLRLPFHGPHPHRDTNQPTEG